MFDILLTPEDFRQERELDKHRGRPTKFSKINYIRKVTQHRRRGQAHQGAQTPRTFRDNTDNEPGAHPNPANAHKPILENIEFRLDMEKLLTPAQFRIAALIMQGYKAADTARALGMNPVTIFDHLQAIGRRLQEYNS
jgi:DNA-binding NarL/FixJ family response regulator